MIVFRLEMAFGFASEDDESASGATATVDVADVAELNRPPPEGRSDQLSTSSADATGFGFGHGSIDANEIIDDGASGGEAASRGVWIRAQDDPTHSLKLLKAMTTELNTIVTQLNLRLSMETSTVVTADPHFDLHLADEFVVDTITPLVLGLIEHAVRPLDSLGILKSYLPKETGDKLATDLLAELEASVQSLQRFFVARREIAVGGLGSIDSAERRHGHRHLEHLINMVEREELQPIHVVIQRRIETLDDARRWWHGEHEDLHGKTTHGSLSHRSHKKRGTHKHGGKTKHGTSKADKSEKSLAPLSELGLGDDEYHHAKSESEKIKEELHTFRRQVLDLMRGSHESMTDKFEWMTKMDEVSLDFDEFWVLVHILRSELITHSHSVHHDEVTRDANVATEKIKWNGKKPLELASVSGFDIEESFVCIFKHFSHEDHDDSGLHIEVSEDTHELMVQWLYVFCALVSNDDNDGAGKGKLEQQKIIAALDALGLPNLLVFMAGTKHSQTAATACDLAVELLKNSPFETAVAGMKMDNNTGCSIAHTQLHFYTVLAAGGGHARRLFHSLKHRIDHEKQHIQRILANEEDAENDESEGQHRAPHRTHEFSALLALIEMLRYCCMGCFAPMQNLLLHQAETVTDHPVNVLSLVCELLASFDVLLLHNLKDQFSISAGEEDKAYPVEALLALQQKEDEIEIITQMFELLTESLSGPNRQNQQALFALNACTSVLSTLRFMQSGDFANWKSIDDNRKMVTDGLETWCNVFGVTTQENLYCVQADGNTEENILSPLELEDVTRLFRTIDKLSHIDEDCESSVMAFLHALTEGNAPGHVSYDSLSEILFRDCDVKNTWHRSTVAINLTSHTKDAKAEHFRVAKDVSNMTGRRVVSSTETATQYHILISNLSVGSAVYGKDLTKALKDWDRSNHSPFKNRVARIEIVRGTVLSAIYFPMPQIVIRTQQFQTLRYLKEHIITQSLMLTDDARVNTFLMAAPLVKEVMKQQYSFSQSYILRWLVRQNEITYIAFALTLPLNFYVLAEFGGDDSLEDKLYDQNIWWSIVGYLHLAVTCLQFIAYVLNHLIIDKHRYSGVVSRPGWNFSTAIEGIKFWVSCTRAGYFILAMMMSALGNFWSPRYFVFGLYDICHWPIPSLIISAIGISLPKLGGTILIAILFMYTFAIVGNANFKGLYDLDFDYCSDANQSLAPCFVDHLFTFGDRMTFDQRIPGIGGFAYGVLYNLLMVLLISNIFVGVISDSFSEIRGNHERFEAAKKNRCYVCSHTRAELEASSETGFDGHINHEHDPFDYVAFMIHVQERAQNHDHLTGPELQFLKALEANSVDKMWPIKRALCIDGITTEDVYDLKHVWQRLDEVVSLARNSSHQLQTALATMSTLTKVTSLETFALLHAAAGGDIIQVESILDQGVDVNTRDYDMRTALHLAAAEGRHAIAALLISKGAEIDVKDRFGLTPTDEATKGGFHNIATLMSPTCETKDLGFAM
jgi:hypothetical protein